MSLVLSDDTIVTSQQQTDFHRKWGNENVLGFRIFLQQLLQQSHVEGVYCSTDEVNVAAFCITAKTGHSLHIGKHEAQSLQYTKTMYLNAILLS